MAKSLHFRNLKPMDVPPIDVVSPCPALHTKFLRVRRSHLVNTRLIERLYRNEPGKRTLYLHNSQPVPVSRRIMPGVRRALR